MDAYSLKVQTSIAILVVALLPASLDAQRGRDAFLRDPQVWDAVDRATMRLPPAAFSNLPAHLRADLERRGCTVPQWYAARTPVNVIQGRFSSQDQMDWAVLCSRARVSSILIFRGGSASAVREIAPRPDRDFLQHMGGMSIGFSRGLSVATPKTIQYFHKNLGGQRPPPLDHDGISDAFIEKASVVWYWHQNRWLSLQGAD
jgi:hypothetical protein